MRRAPLFSSMVFADKHFKENWFLKLDIFQLNKVILKQIFSIKQYLCLKINKVLKNLFICKYEITK